MTTHAKALEALRLVSVYLPSDCEDRRDEERIPAGFVYLTFGHLRKVRAALAEAAQAAPESAQSLGASASPTALSAPALRASAPIAGATALQTEAATRPDERCACGDRPAAECDDEWGPNCDLGNNPAHSRGAR